jgi:tetratricopeptide (TPR) repeat protein
MSQVLLSDEDLIALRAPTGGLGRRIFSPGQQLGIPPEDKANDEAERLFRRALNVDPDFVEARVRLARLLDVRKRHDEAASELKTALEAHSSPAMVAFYAHLFAGRAAQALGRMEEASDHYAKALTLFPRAQSALLAQSQAALLESDVAGALAPIDRLVAPAWVSRADDPWWVYHFGAGRDSDALLREMWAEVAR